jgi:ABC-type dipeptide/oligopeptide/nickel transport system permease component
MLAFIGRRIAISFLILFGSSFLVYNMEAIAGDPLAALAESSSRNKAYLIARLTAQLQLNVPPPARYFIWLKGLAGVFVGHLDFGKTRSGGAVLDLVGAAVPVTLRLVTAATLLAIILGISVGVFASRLLDDFRVLLVLLTPSLLGCSALEAILRNWLQRLLDRWAGHHIVLDRDSTCIRISYRWIHWW